jgi:hypothetical protein
VHAAAHSLLMPCHLSQLLRCSLLLLLLLLLLGRSLVPVQQC